MYNSLARWKKTGTWEDHMSYSLGGEDYGTPYNSVVAAPATGVIRTSGGSGEFAAGWIGSAGRRAILELAEPIGDVVAVVMQHLAAFPEAREYQEGEACFLTGASANHLEWGGQVHAHIHCLTAKGERRQFTNYINGSISAGTGDRTPVGMEQDVPKIHKREDNGRMYFITPQRIMHIADDKELPALRYSINTDKQVGYNENVGKDDFRIVIQAYGFDYDKVNTLAPGESLDIAGYKYGRNNWPGYWE